MIGVCFGPSAFTCAIKVAQLTMPEVELCLDPSGHLGAIALAAAAEVGSLLDSTTAPSHSGAGDCAVGRPPFPAGGSQGSACSMAEGLEAAWPGGLPPPAAAAPDQGCTGGRPRPDVRLRRGSPPQTDIWSRRRHSSPPRH
jgi:hypothetical protein